MMGGNRKLFEEVLGLVEYWVPEKAHGREHDFRAELKEFLETELNSGGNDPLGMGMGGGKDHVVEKEHGRARADICVDEVIGIEMKRNLTNHAAKNDLKSQLDNYSNDYPFVIACSCGIEDTAWWRKLKNKYNGNGGFGFDSSEVAFVHKKKENYGKNPDSLNNSGGFFGGMF